MTDDHHPRRRRARIAVPEGSSRAFRLALELGRPRRRHLLWAIVGAAISLAAIVAVPLVSRAAIDEVVVAGRADAVAPYAVAVVVLGLARALGSALRKYQATKFMVVVGTDLRDRLFDHLQALSFFSHQRLGVGQLMARAAGDVTAFENAMSALPFFFQSMAMGALSAVVLVIINPLLGAILLAVTVPVAVPVIRRSRLLHSASRDLQDSLGEFSQFVEQQVAGFRVVKGHGLEGAGRGHGDRLAVEVLDRGQHLGHLRGRFLAAFLTVPSAALVTALGLGGLLTAAGRMTPGDLFASLQYLSALTAPLAVTAQISSHWHQASGAAARIAEVLDIQPAPADPARPQPMPDGPGALHFDGVTFGYEPGAPVIEDLSLEIEPGTAVALVGATGSGKSTLAHLVARFHDVWEGEIRIDGVPVDRIMLREVRHAVGMVFEDTVLFSASVRENIALGRPDATAEEIEAAAVVARAHDFVVDLPHGYGTVLGGEGMTLSGGQRQRVAIARAVLRDPRILILDDATSAVDPHTEDAVRRGLEEVMRDRTTVIVAHRPESAALADRVILLDRGRVVADGCHDDLVALPEYRQALGITDGRTAA